MKLIQRENSHPKQFEKISPTAILCAKIKAEYTNIPYARRIYEELKHLGHVHETQSFIPRRMDQKFKIDVSILEGRHLAINEAITHIADHAILELSAGLSPRGLVFAKRPYIETDLRSMISLKKKILANITKEEPIPHNLLPLNPLNLQELIAFGELFKARKENKILFINEGLLMYLSTQEQEKLRDNIAYFLRKYSPQGYWITTDFSSRPIQQNNQTMIATMKKIEGKTNRKFNRFKSEAHVHSFLEKGGLYGKPVQNKEIVQNLSCLKTLRITHEEAKSVSPRYKAWKIGLR